VYSNWYLLLEQSNQGNRQSSKKNNKYQMPEHVEVDEIYQE